jgi:hypothetical protein
MLMRDIPEVKYIQYAIVLIIAEFMSALRLKALGQGSQNINTIVAITVIGLAFTNILIIMTGMIGK